MAEEALWRHCRRERDSIERSVNLLEKWREKYVGEKIGTNSL